MNKLIMVEEPYDILQDLVLNSDGSMNARVENEYLPDFEGGPIGCAEFGRHLAVLGSIVLSNVFNFSDNHYYLAVQASLERVHHDVYEAPNLQLYARPVHTSKRTGSIYGELKNLEGDVIFTGTVEYQVLSKAVFAKFYASRYRETPLSFIGLNPYVSRKHLTNISIQDGEVTGYYGEVLEHECQGHFRNYPALPVVIVGGLFGELGTPLFQHYLKGFSKVIGLSSVIKAHRMAFCGEVVHLKGRLVERVSDDVLMMTAEAMVGNELVADIAFTLKGVNVFDENVISIPEMVAHSKHISS